MQSTVLTEDHLGDLVLDLHDYYGLAFPRPRGAVIEFKVVHVKSTMQEAENQIKSILSKHGVRPLDLKITPGRELAGKVTRTLTFAVPKVAVT